MSQTLTNFYSSYKRRGQKSSSLKGWVAVVLVMLAVLVLIISVIVKNSPTKNYLSKSFYFVYAGNYTSRALASNCANDVSDLGGAGVIYNVGNSLFVVAGVYFTKPEAEKVATQISARFKGAGVLAASSASVSKSTAKALHQVESCRNYFAELYQFCQNLYTWTNSLEVGEIDASKLYKNVMTVKQNITSLAAHLSEQDAEFAEVMYSSSLVVCEHISSFFSSAFASSDISKHARKLCVNVVIEFMDMCGLL